MISLFGAQESTIMECGNSTVNKRRNVSYSISKRVLDIIVAHIGLIFWPMVLIGVLIKLESPGPAVFVHNRVGKMEIPFRC